MPSPRCPSRIGCGRSTAPALKIWAWTGSRSTTPLPKPGPDELLVRHDAVGICFSDIKVIRTGEKHPRIHRKMKEDPVVLGHEVALTIVEAGANLRDQYKPGDRFIVQADIYINGKSYAYGYEMQGGFSRYAVDRLARADRRPRQLPDPDSPGCDGYAEVALCEPWACVEASYTVEYRTRWQDGGMVWLVGNGAGIRFGQASTWRPRKVVLDVQDAAFADQVRKWAQADGVEVVEGDDGDHPLRRHRRAAGRRRTVRARLWPPGQRRHLQPGAWPAV